jgi:hypothetical protein
MKEKARGSDRAEKGREKHVHLQDLGGVLRRNAFWRVSKRGPPQVPDNEGVPFVGTGDKRGVDGHSDGGKILIVMTPRSAILGHGNDSRQTGPSLP